MSENKLRVRDVDFNGAELRAAQEIETGKVYVGVRWVCQGMGFDHERMKNERKKIQKDIVLSEGVKFYPLGSGNSGTEVLCLDLDFIPLWLAKISITPTMQKENPDLVNKLIDYQLHAKDVLAAAFLNKESETQPGLKAKGNILQVQLPEINVPDYSDEIKIMTDKMQRLIDDNMAFYFSSVNDIKTSILEYRSNTGTIYVVVEYVIQENEYDSDGNNITKYIKDWYTTRMNIFVKDEKYNEVAIFFSYKDAENFMNHDERELRMEF